LKGSERYSPARVEANAFTLEKASLPCAVPRKRADCALCIHDALPRNRRVGRQRVECVTDEARLPGQAGEARHLPVGSYAASRYP
jgi:hypothetical protein